MTTADGTVKGATKIIDNGPDVLRWNVVILGDGYQDSELATFAADAQQLADTLKGTAPFGPLWPGMNVYRVDVASTDSGADNPVACGGNGTTARTYFDATYCGNGTLQRLLTVNDATALNVAKAQVPNVNLTFVIVNDTMYGGSGGPVAVFSKDPQAVLIALHEMGHTAFGLADEYPTLAGCGSGETGHDRYTGSEPAQPNATTVTDPATIKWASLLSPGTLPTTVNGDCSMCDPQASPVPPGTVGAFEGACYCHCGAYRPEYTCRMGLDLTAEFCAVCASVITATITPFVPATPVVTGFTPVTGDPGGGTVVVITGSGFLGGGSGLSGVLAVDFGPNAAVAFNVDSDTQITALSPPGIGSVNIEVTTAAGSTAASLATEFTYAAAVAPPPVVTGVAPSSGPAGGGTLVTVSGSMFTGAGAVMFGSVPAAGFSVDADTQITAESPALPASGTTTVDVTVRTAGGTSHASSADQFTFSTVLPAITGVTPSAGPVSGGATVVITGSNFAPGGYTTVSEVAFGGAPAAYSVDSDSQITAVSPPGAGQPGALGTVDVTVTSADGTSVVVPADLYTYLAAPAVTGVTPAGGSAGGGDAVVLTGTGFTGATDVGFGVTGATAFSVDSDTQITVTSPPATGLGTVDVTVTGPGGTSLVSPADQFTYA